ncbi:MAG: hypothetical protein F6K30_05900 [Cyanothece sp. SIO2G6]|nr:hypothetical protein [Cyanothece sp. SIO2G6]
MKRFIISMLTIMMTVTVWAMSTTPVLADGIEYIAEADNTQGVFHSLYVDFNGRPTVISDVSWLYYADIMLQYMLEDEAHLFVENAEAADAVEVVLRYECEQNDGEFLGTEDYTVANGGLGVAFEGTTRRSYCQFPQNERNAIFNEMEGRRL